MPHYHGNTFFRTFGRKPPNRMGAWERAAKKKLNSQMLWRQLEAISNGVWVNHLGRRHSPRIEERDQYRWGGEALMNDARQFHEQTLDEMREAMIEIHEHKKPSPSMEKMIEDRARELLQPIAEPVKSDRYKEPFVYYEDGVGTGGVPAAICTCGWRKPHYRFKVLKKAAIRHFEKTGHRLA